MIEVTQRAKQELKKLLHTKVDNPQARLRLTATEKGQLGLNIDIEKQDDQVVEHEGSKVLVVEDGLAAKLSGVTIDVQDTPEGPQLVISTESKEQ